MKWVLTHDNGRDLYTLYADHGYKMFYIKSLTAKDLKKLHELIDKILQQDNGNTNT